jgi:diacylglycerol kinase (ATP)
MSRALLIANPVASKVDEDVVAVIRSECAGAGWNLEVAATLKAGDARRHAERAVADRFDRVICYGGDGTAMQAAAALVGTGVPLALVPGGTGNLLAGNLRLPRTALQAARVAVRGRGRRIDLGRVPRDDGDHYFAVSSGAGWDALVMSKTSTEAKHRWGTGAYWWTAIRELSRVRNVPHTVTVDGQAIETQAALVMVANCGEIVPPWLRFHRDIAMDDGVLDVVIVSADRWWHGPLAAWQMWSAREPVNGRVRFVRGREVEVRASTPQPVQLDGDPMGTTPLRATIVPGALEVVVAAGLSTAGGG